MLEGNFIIALLLTLGAGIATGIGGAIIMFVKRFNPKMLCATLGFSAGVSPAPRLHRHGDRGAAQIRHQAL